MRDLCDRTASFDDLDFAFSYRDVRVTLDVKEKRQRYSKGVQHLWPALAEPDMFIVDETVFRRVVRVEPYPIHGTRLLWELGD